LRIRNGAAADVSSVPAMRRRVDEPAKLREAVQASTMYPEASSRSSSTHEQKEESSQHFQS
jgi:hypothetical protein